VKPTTFRRDGDEFLAVWDAAKIGIAFSRIRETDSGQLYAELEIHSTRPDASGTLLAPARINLSASTDRKRLADLLAQRAADVLWSDALEAAIARVIREWRTPEPLQDLWEDVSDPGENTYLLHPLLVENDTNLWYADEQSLKSYLSMVCAVAVSKGLTVPGVGTPSKVGPVVIYDWETFDGKQRRRLTRVANGWGLGKVPGIYYRRMSRPVADCIAPIRAEVSRLGAVLVIFDSLGWMANGNLNDSAVSLPTMNAVGAISGVTRLVLAHHGKSGREDGNTPSVFGSGFFEFASRNRWLIRKSQDEESDTVRIGLYHKKASDDARFGSIGLAFTFDKTRDAVTVAPCDLEDEPTLLRDASPQAKILAALRQTEFMRATVKEISAETKIPESTVKFHLLKMDGTRVQRVSVNGLAGGRGHAAQWAPLAETVEKTVDPLSVGETNGFSPLRGETVGNKPLKTVGDQRFRGDEDEFSLPF
jgi:hypothetical protein